MEKNDIKVVPAKVTSVGNTYDDHNIPSEDLTQDVIPDEVPGKGGPGGEPSDCHRDDM